MGPNNMGWEAATDRLLGLGYLPNLSSDRGLAVPCKMCQYIAFAVQCLYHIFLQNCLVLADSYWMVLRLLFFPPSLLMTHIFSEITFLYRYLQTLIWLLSRLRVEVDISCLSIAVCCKFRSPQSGCFFFLSQWCLEHIPQCVSNILSV